MATATTPLGKVAGTEVDGIERYAGIRYAKAPVADRRFRPPEPVDPWDGTYEATAFGPSAPQAPPVPGSFLAEGELRTDEVERVRRALSRIMRVLDEPSAHVQRAHAHAAHGARLRRDEAHEPRAATDHHPRQDLPRAVHRTTLDDGAAVAVAIGG